MESFLKELATVTVLNTGSEPLEPTEEVSALAAEASRRLFRVLGIDEHATHVVRFENAPNEPVVWPAGAVRLLRDLLRELAKGNTVVLMPLHVELTTQEAADLLNVSRPFLVGLVESDELPNHKVGTHSQVRFTDLMTYKRRRDAEAEQALGEMSAMAQGMKLY